MVELAQSRNRVKSSSSKSFIFISISNVVNFLISINQTPLLYESLIIYSPVLNPSVKVRRKSVLKLLTKRIIQRLKFLRKWKELLRPASTEQSADCNPRARVPPAYQTGTIVDSLILISYLLSIINRRIR